MGAGKDASVQVSADDAAYSDCGGFNSSIDESVKDLDVTEYNDGSNQRIPGLMDGQFTIDGNRDPANAGQVILDTAFRAGTNVWVKIFPDGASGVKAECLVTNRKIDPPVNDKVTVKYTMKLANGDVTDV